MKLTKIGEFLKRSKIPVDIEDKVEYNRVTIRINHNGVSLRDSEIGRLIGTKKQFILKSGQFIVSKIDARYGAFGIAPEEVENAIITGNFWAYDVDTKLVNIDWFNQFTNSPIFYEVCERASSGITHRKYLDEKFFLNYEILLPTVDEQLVQIKKINLQKESFGEISTELTHQLSLVKKLRQQLLQDAVQGKLLKSSPPVLGGVSAGRGGQINNLPHLKTFRKHLRNNLTAAEAKLWSTLKGKNLNGKKFRRQFSVANYILDFYCPEEHLAIELDGQGHFEATQAEYDAERDLFLNYFGIKVLRFENKWVWNDLDGLLENIKSSFGWREKNPSVLRTAPLEGEQLEDASELLKKIKAEKEKLIAEKKLKKEKELPPIKPEEIPFEIPDNWVWCRLGDICTKIGSGSTPKGSNYSTNGKPFFRSQNIYDGGLVYEDIKYISDEVHKQMSGTTVFANDILLNITGGSMGRCALVPNDFEEGNVSQHVCIIRPLLVDNNFYHSIALSPFFQKFIFSSTTGAGREGLPKYNLEQFIIPLPPLAEQIRIVKKLDELMQYCNELEASIKQSQIQNEKLLQQVLREALRKEPVEA